MTAGDFARRLAGPIAALARELREPDRVETGACCAFCLQPFSIAHGYRVLCCDCWREHGERLQLPRSEDEDVPKEGR